MNVKKESQRSLDISGSSSNNSDDFDEFRKAESTLSDEEQDGLLHQRPTTRASRLCRSVKLIWLPLVLISWVLSIIVTWRLTSLSFDRVHSWENGFEADMPALKGELEMERRRFTAELDWDENGQLYSIEVPDAKKYVGKPSPEIDANWAELIPGEGVDVIGKEAEGVNNGFTYVKPSGHSVVSIEVFHQLHCVNIIRKTLDLDYYGINEWDPETYRLHIDHCLDILRQAVMCVGDITPIPIEWRAEFHRPRPIFGRTEHTCRNFDKIHSWAAARNQSQHDWFIPDEKRNDH